MGALRERASPVRGSSVGHPLKLRDRVLFDYRECDRQWQPQFKRIDDDFGDGHGKQCGARDVADWKSNGHRRTTAVGNRDRHRPRPASSGTDLQLWNRAPPGMSITPPERSVDPDRGPGPGTYSVTVRVTDSGGPAPPAALRFTVNEANQPPYLPPSPAKPFRKEEPSRHSPRLPTRPTAADTHVSLEPGAPAGMSISSSSGGINWTPTEAQGPGNYV